MQGLELTVTFKWLVGSCLSVWTLCLMFIGVFSYKWILLMRNVLGRGGGGGGEGDLSYYSLSTVISESCSFSLGHSMKYT